MRRRIALLGILGFSVALAGAVFVRRVPPQRALVSGSRVLGPGWHVAPRGGSLVPLGEREARFRSPEAADFRLFDRDTAEVAVDVRFVVPVTLEGLRARPDPVPGSGAVPSLRRTLRAWVAACDAESLIAASAEDAGRTSLAGTLTRRRGEASWEAREVRFFDASAPPSRRVLVVGVDAGDWEIMTPLLAAGALPHLAGLAERGVSASLRSIQPLLSPLIWTTIATGVSPAVHGVLDFVTRDPDGAVRPVGSDSRRVPALWNYMEACGRRVSVVGWLATYPAERVPGTLLSDRFGFLAFVDEAARRPDSRTTWPPELAQEAESYRVDPRDLPDSLVAAFAHVPPESLAAARERGFRKGKLLNNLLHTLAAAETNRRIARWQWERERPDLGLFYFELVDAVGHLTMPYAPPRLPWITERDYAAYRDGVASAYRFQDAILGDLLSVAGESTLVVVLSDHGFKSGEERPRTQSEIGVAGAAHWHNPEGILLLAGPGVRKGVRLPNATVTDIAPTLLAFLGCEVPASMEGRVLAEAFDPPLAVRRGAGRSAARPAAAPAETTASGLNNLGLSQWSAGRLEEALATFRRAVEADPRSVTARNNVGMVLLRLERPAEAARELEQAVTQDRGYPPAWLNLGLAYMGLREPARAREAFLEARRLDPGNPRVLRGLGFASLDLADWDGAAAAFRAALRAEDTAPGHFGLAMALERSGDTAGAEAELERTLELDPRHAEARKALAALRGPG